MDDFLYFNGFGLVTVTTEKVSVTITAIQGEKEITRTVEKSLEDQPGFEGSGTYTIGILMDPEKPTRITFKELSTQMHKNLLSVGPIKDTIKNAIDLVRNSAEFA